MRLQLTDALDLKNFAYTEEGGSSTTTTVARACHALLTVVLHEAKLRNFSFGNSIFPPAHGERYRQVLPGGCTVRRGYSIGKLESTLHNLKARLTLAMPKRFDLLRIILCVSNRSG